MKPHLRVVEPGLCTTVQDLGRQGYQAMGVPVSGIRDAVSLRIGNAITGNPENTEGLEISLQGPMLEVMSDSVRVLLFGTDTGYIEVVKPDQRTISAWHSVRLERGTVFKVTNTVDTFGGGLAIEGGFAIPNVLDSKSTFLLGGIGGFKGRQLHKDDELPLVNASVSIRDEQVLDRPVDLVSDDIIRVVLGPQDDYFEPESIQTFLEKPYLISFKSDRVGLRLEGPELKHSKGFNIVSDGIVTGAIQVPGNGLPIILFNDHQLTGGYPKIANIISSDLPKLGRMQPQKSIQFKSVSVQEAEDIRYEQECKLKEILRRLPTYSENDRIENTGLLPASPLRRITNMFSNITSFFSRKKISEN